VSARCRISRHLGAWAVLALWILGAASAQAMRVEGRLEPERPWQQQPALFTLQVDEAPEAIEVRVDTWNQEGLFIEPLPAEERRVRTDAGWNRQYLFRWLVVPLRPGVQVLQPPAPTVRLRGGSTPMAVSVRPYSFEARGLPEFLPAAVPFGPLSISPLDEPAPLRGTVQRWSFSVAGIGLLRSQLLPWAEAWSEDWAQSWSREISDRGPPSRDGVIGSGAGTDAASRNRAARLILLTPSITPLPVATGDLPLLRRYRVDLAWISEQGGRVRLPDWQLPFIDPELGRLDAVRFPGPELLVQRQGERWVGPGLGVALGLASMVVLLRIAAAGLYRLRRQWQWRQGLAGARDARALRTWAQHWAPSHGWPADLLAALDQAAYGAPHANQTAHSIGELKQWLKRATQTRPRR